MRKLLPLALAVMMASAAAAADSTQAASTTPSAAGDTAAPVTTANDSMSVPLASPTPAMNAATAADSTQPGPSTTPDVVSNPPAQSSPTKVSDATSLSTSNVTPADTAVPAVVNDNNLAASASLNPAAVSNTDNLMPEESKSIEPNDLTVSAPSSNIESSSQAATPTATTNLWEIYQLAAQNDGTYQAAQASFKAQQEDAPIAFGALLPGVSATANTTWNENKGSPDYNSNGYGLALSQPLFNFGSWKTYSQAQVTVKIQALVLATAEQTLVMSVATDYFQVLADQDNLRYAKANQEALQQSLMQTQQKYNVGLAAMSDVQSARSQYEQAIASTVKAENALATDLENLAVLTGQPVGTLAQLKPQFTLFKPDPADPQAWVNVGLKQNLTLQQDYLQVDADKLGVDIARAGYLPTATGTANFSYARSNSSSPATSTTTRNVGVNASYALFSGFSTVATVKKARYTTEADAATAENQSRQTVSSVRQDYLNVLSDISQIQAYEQAVISGQSSLDAARAAYEVGTKTLVDLLTQQSTLFQNQQLYVSAIQSYISDSLKLKQDSGLLTAHDLSMINDWLLQALNPAPATAKTTTS